VRVTLLHFELTFKEPSKLPRSCKGLERGYERLPSSRLSITLKVFPSALKWVSVLLM